LTAGGDADEVTEYRLFLDNLGRGVIYIFGRKLNRGEDDIKGPEEFRRGEI